MWIVWKILWKERTRFLITVAGVGFSAMLILFLFGVYEGVKAGATRYVADSPAKIWICQNNSNNLLRSSSFLKASLNDAIQQTEEVDEVTGILRVLVTATIHDRPFTLFVFGFDPESKLSAPSMLMRGHSDIHSGDIILDKAFARKHRLTMGDSIQIQGKTFRVSGICEGTNTIVAQFAFTTLRDAQKLLGFSDIVSFFLISTTGKIRIEDVILSLKKRFPELAVFTKRVFIQNNLQEMSTGVLQILGTIALFGIIIGAAVITLMLYGSILEKREDYALFKALGANQKYLVSLVLWQSLLLATMGFAFGLLFNISISPLIIRFVPEMTLIFSWQAAVTVFVLCLCVGALGSWMPIHKIRYIYPAEVFRA